MQRLVIGIVSIVLCGTITASVSADALAVSRVITVQGVVSPARYIIVDSTAGITSIISNTANDVIPQVYFDKIASGNERQLTTELYQKYQVILQSAANKLGEIYKQSPSAYKTQAPNLFDPHGIVHGAKLQPDRVWSPDELTTAQTRYQ